MDNAEAVGRPQPSESPSGTIAEAILGVGAADVARRELSVEAVVEIIRDEIGERTRAAAEYERLGRADQASGLRAEAAVLVSFLEDA